jgi:hypothetical protein
MGSMDTSPSMKSSVHGAANQVLAPAQPVSTYTFSQRKNTFGQKTTSQRESPFTSPSTHSTNSRGMPAAADPCILSNARNSAHSYSSSRISPTVDNDANLLDCQDINFDEIYSAKWDLLDDTVTDDFLSVFGDHDLGATTFETVTENTGGGTRGGVEMLQQPSSSPRGRKEKAAGASTVVDDHAGMVDGEPVLDPFHKHLQSIIAAGGGKFPRIPVVGGSRLNLQRLLVLVQYLGGPVSVTENKQWRGIALKMDIPLTCTNAGFLLRKYYTLYIAPYINDLISYIDFSGEKQLDILSDDTLGTKESSESTEKDKDISEKGVDSADDDNGCEPDKKSEVAVEGRRGTNPHAKRHVNHLTNPPAALKSHSFRPKTNTTPSNSSREGGGLLHIKIGDIVVVFDKTPGSPPSSPLECTRIAKVLAFRNAASDNETLITVCWYFRPREVMECFLPEFGVQEVFMSRLRGDCLLSDCMSVCTVHSYGAYKALPKKSGSDYFVRFIYEPNTPEPLVPCLSHEDMASTGGFSKLACCNQFVNPDRAIVECIKCSLLFHPEHIMQNSSRQTLDNLAQILLLPDSSSVGGSSSSCNLPIICPTCSSKAGIGGADSVGHSDWGLVLVGSQVSVYSHSTRQWEDALVSAFDGAMSLHTFTASSESSDLSASASAPFSKCDILWKKWIEHYGVKYLSDGMGGYDSHSKGSYIMRRSSRRRMTPSSSRSDIKGPPTSPVSGSSTRKRSSSDRGDPEPVYLFGRKRSSGSLGLLTPDVVSPRTLAPPPLIVPSKSNESETVSSVSLDDITPLTEYDMMH